MLRDWIVCGIEDQKIQRRLLAEPELTFDKAFELALASKSADKNAKDLQPAAKVPQDPVHKIQVKHDCPAITVEGNTSQETVVTKLQSATTVIKLDT